MIDNNFDKEVDLGKIFFSLKRRLNQYLYNIINNIYKNKLKLFFLVIAGCAIGAFLNHFLEKKQSSIIVFTNNNSVDYLYSKVANLQTNTNQKKQLGINFIKVEPIIDIYGFTIKNKSNLETLKLFTADKDFSQIVTDKDFIKNFDMHTITIKNNKLSLSKKNIDNLMKFLNEDKFYKQLLLTTKENYLEKINQNKILISQIDLLIKNFNNKTISSKGDNLLFNNENIQLDNLLKTKKDLLNDNDFIKIKLIEIENTINLVSYNLNTIVKPSFNFILIIPILFIILYYFFLNIINFYKNYNNK